MSELFINNNEMPSDHWKDKDFVAEMEDRYREYKSGKAKLISLEEAKAKAKAAVKKKLPHKDKLLK